MSNSANEAIKVSVLSMATNFILAAFKLFAGIFSHSAAMISDAVHSASDVVSTIVVIVGIKISEKEPDEEHPYGHERMECVAALILAAMLAAVGVGIGKTGLESIMSGDYKTKAVPGVVALAAALVSILVKEFMFQLTMRTAKRVNSSALKADAWHHRSDALSSIGALVGIVGAMLGFGVTDVIASLVICLFILKASFDVFVDGVNGMVDHAVEESLLEEIRTVIIHERGVVKIDELKSRRFGAKIYIDVEISVDGNLSLFEAHEIAEDVHDVIEAKFPDIKHCMVHENPA